MVAVGSMETDKLVDPETVVKPSLTISRYCLDESGDTTGLARLELQGGEPGGLQVHW